jgi:hypothetical protein
MVRFSDLLGRGDGEEPRRDRHLAAVEGAASDGDTPNEPTPPPPTEPPPPPPPASPESPASPEAPAGADLLERLTDYATRAAAAVPPVIENAQDEPPETAPDAGARADDVDYVERAHVVDDDLLPRRKRRK